MTTSHLKGRLEDHRYVTGTGRYTADRNVTGQLHAYFIRADRPHAQIVSIDASAAKSTKGVHLILTGEDMVAAGVKTIPVNSIAGKSRDGSELIKTIRPALATGKTRYVGEPVVCVVAESAVIAQDAAEHITIEYKDLPHVTRAVDAMKPGAPQLHDNVPGNRVLGYGNGTDEAKVDAAIKSAKR